MKTLSRTDIRFISFLFSTLIIILGLLGIFFANETHGTNQFEVVPKLGWCIITIGITSAIIIAIRARSSQIELGILFSVSLSSICFWLNVMLFTPFINSTFPTWLKTLGIFAGLAPNIWWCAKIAICMKELFNNQKLRDQLYEDHGSYFIFKRGVQEKPMKSLRTGLTPPWYIFAAFTPIYPLSMTIPKFLVSHFDIQVFSILSSTISLPLSLLFNGGLVFCLICYIYNPLILQIKTGKEVIYSL
ncbi:hypothetical protein QU481_03250 [Crenobacter sp. SG2303]|uniref:Uncharacterized protein n=1 Tax=Crenobacter oryzisoli TaxID=3056844 RepID=A0ABT7XJE4_9NEIS|nr:hypothetical protein [Crenobacter sp. SG2303]MDN0073908.1 hypothetical protein [Crenobacter sp. SG2303]